MYWLSSLFLIVAAGIASRAGHTGWIVLDKYLGDTLYAAMIYVLLSLFWHGVPLRKAIVSMILMTALELFQLTRIPAHLLTNDSVPLRTIARVLGTEFGFLDLIAYSLGIIAIASIEFTAAKSWNNSPPSMLE